MSDGQKVKDPLRDDAIKTLRRTVGKFAFLAAFIYVLALMAGVAMVVQHFNASPFTWPLLILPGAAFVPAVVDAVRLHRTDDPERMKTLWKMCAIYTIAGVILLFSVAFSLNELNGS